VLMPTSVRDIRGQEKHHICDGQKDHASSTMPSAVRR
jgi:hypothetical protein